MPDLPAWHKRCLEIGLLEVIPGVQDNHLLEGPGPCFMIWIYLDYCKREVSLRQEKKRAETARLATPLATPGERCCKTLGEWNLLLD